MTTSYKYKKAIPTWVVFALIFVIAIIIATIFLGEGDIMSGLGILGDHVFVFPLAWGAESRPNGAIVISTIVIVTAIGIFLYTKRRYLKSTTVEVPITAGTPLQGGLINTQPLQTPSTGQIIVEDDKQ